KTSRTRLGCRPSRHPRARARFTGWASGGGSSARRFGSPQERSSGTGVLTGIARWKGSYRDSLHRATTFGGGVIGNTTGSGPVIGGSSPPPRARTTFLPRSSRGLGRQVLILVTRVRIPYGVPSLLPPSAPDRSWVRGSREGGLIVPRTTARRVVDPLRHDRG